MTRTHGTVIHPVIARTRLHPRVISRDCCRVELHDEHLSKICSWRRTRSSHGQGQPDARVSCRLEYYGILKYFGINFKMLLCTRVYLSTMVTCVVAMPRLSQRRSGQSGSNLSSNTSHEWFYSDDEHGVHLVQNGVVTHKNCKHNACIRVQGVIAIHGQNCSKGRQKGSTN